MIGFLWGFLGVVFGAGVAWATMGAKVQKAQMDVNNIGGITRANDRKAERRWLHEIADRVEELEPTAKAARLAHRIREDAWRN